MGVRDLTNISSVCKEWYTITSQNVLWNKFVPSQMIETENQNENHKRENFIKELYVH